ncbi:MAG: hypothetical protein KC587_11995 [Nitrospira sp.]|nr:hypothetical protein [Nitrospira sp.]
MHHYSHHGNLPFEQEYQRLMESQPSFLGKEEIYQTLIIRKGNGNCRLLLLLPPGWPAKNTLRDVAGDTHIRTI